MNPAIPIGGLFVMKYFTDAHLDGLIHYQVPKILVIGDKYKKMKPNAKLLYMVLVDRIKLSMKNGWKDENGRYYVRMSKEKGAELLGFSDKTFINMKKELESYGLLEQKQQGLTKTNLLFVGMLDYTEEDIYKLNNEVDDMLEDAEKHAENVDTTLKGKSYTSRSVKVTLQEVKKLHTSNNDSINKDFKELEEEEDTSTPTVTLHNVIDLMNQKIQEREITNLKTITAILDVAEDCKAIGTTNFKAVSSYIKKVVDEKISKLGQKQREKQSNKRTGKGKAIRTEIVPDWLESNSGQVEAPTGTAPATEPTSIDEERKRLEKELAMFKKKDNPVYV
ncbi:replication initiator protein A [Arthrobacter sp. NPDC057013]|uniref:replication initiator protein A n=1 Tax=Arthrobacter sp. NPDC057013 TaxID=3345999 RepID=UPI00362B0126